MSDYDLIIDAWKALGVQVPPEPQPVELEQARKWAQQLRYRYATTRDAMYDKEVDHVGSELVGLLIVAYGIAAEHGLPIDRMLAQAIKAGTTFRDYPEGGSFG